MNIYESAENYLEAILSLHERHGLVRSIDIANELHFSKPSVSVAMKKLRRERVHRDGPRTALSPCCPRGRRLRGVFMSGTSC